MQRSTNVYALLHADGTCQRENMKDYLGDSVYVEVENGMIKLTTDNGMGASNAIYLENFVMGNLINYWRKVTTPDGQKGINQS